MPKHEITLREALDAGTIRVGDGAMGTSLQDAGLDDGGAPELWNVEKADAVARILREYAQAGANLLTTNTFGGTTPRLLMHGLEDRLDELNTAAAQLARGVADEFDNVYVLGDFGPSGDLMEPMGILTPADARALFAAQAQALLAGGVDGFLIETMSDLSEIESAIQGVRSVAPELPIFATMSFDTNLRTMMGVKPEDAVVALASYGADVVGANCGRGIDEIRIIAEAMIPAMPDGTKLILQSNAGLPVLVKDTFRYNGTPQEMGQFAVDAYAMGVDIVGACCGSRAEHIAALATAVR
ncbi:MAG: homocysteine S-methyltransferase family protein [Candidatus Nanopelagicales bacterium]|jgi:5-methyltetrahydrofolate--homocysteine methyltransferase|nr:homocysteine S-methyltransferase family protein [Candidatus Nanopelagicales bacterium]